MLRCRRKVCEKLSYKKNYLQKTKTIFRTPPQIKFGLRQKFNLEKSFFEYLPTF